MDVMIVRNLQGVIRTKMKDYLKKTLQKKKYEEDTTSVPKVGE